MEQVAGRTILHSDLNSFYASVECMLDPSLRNRPVAVCGSTEDRHGIVLAKSELAKRAGIKTGMVNWEARRKCPELIVLPPQYDQYLKYSKLAREIYQRYTDQVEPYGMDECWLDITGSVKIFGGGQDVAHRIRKAVNDELGMTVSVGVSFNKVFAKLGSDMRKPDAVTVIDRNSYRETVWPLPASDLLYVGRATERKLSEYGIRTIGEIATADPGLLQRRLGVNGRQLWVYANGWDQSRVMTMDYRSPVKSIGHGITCSADLGNNEEVWRVFLELSQDIGHKLRVNELCSKGVQITVKDNALSSKQYQAHLSIATRSPMEIALKARELFERNYLWHTHVRAVTVRAIDLVSNGTPQQLDIFYDHNKQEKQDRLEVAIEDIRARFGKRAVRSASLMRELKIPGHGASEVILPGYMYQ